MSEPEVAVNGLISVPSESSDKLPTEVSDELASIQDAGILSSGDLDGRAFDAIRGLSVTEALSVLAELRKTNLEHVSNKSAFLCGLIKTFRQKSKMGNVARNGDARINTVRPDEAKIKEILDRTGYSLDVSTGQRRYGGPPPNWSGPQPGPGHEIYCGKLPKDLFEDSLIPLFENIGAIWDLRLMMDPISGRNRGYCFVTFTERKAAEEAVKQLNNFEIQPGKYLKVNASVANVRLFVGNIPKNRSRDEIFEEFQKSTEGLVDVIVYNSPDDPSKFNRGFAFLDYDSHKSASAARRTITSTRLQVWGSEVIVEWAEPQEEPDEETMSKVKVLYIRNLRSDINEAQLKEKFEDYGPIERVKRVKSYGFVHFSTRELALKAMEELNGTLIGESVMDISLAKPSSRNKQREKWRHPNGGFYGGRNGYNAAYNGYNAPAGRGGRGRPYRYYGYSYQGPFSYMPAYDYYGYDMNVYGYYGGQYGGGNFYKHPGRGRSAGAWSRGSYRPWNGNRGSRGRY